MTLSSKRCLISRNCVLLQPIAYFFILNVSLRNFVDSIQRVTYFSLLALALADPEGQSLSPLLADIHPLIFVIFVAFGDNQPMTLKFDFPFPANFDHSFVALAFLHLIWFVGL